MIRRPPRSTRTDTPLSLHDALPISAQQALERMTWQAAEDRYPEGVPDKVQRLLRHELRLIGVRGGARSEEHTSELQSLMRISYAVFCLKKKTHAQLYNTSSSAHQHDSQHIARKNKRPNKQ